MSQVESEDSDDERVLFSFPPLLSKCTFPIIYSVSIEEPFQISPEVFEESDMLLFYLDSDELLTYSGTIYGRQGEHQS